MSDGNKLKMQRSLTLSEIEANVFKMIEELAQWSRNADRVDLSEVYVGIAGFRSECFRYKVILMKNRQDLRCSQYIATTLDPFIDELTEQFKIWSRIGSMRQLDWDMNKG